LVKEHFAFYVGYVLDQFGDHVRDAFSALSSRMAQMGERKRKLEAELRRLAATAAETGPSAFLVEAINEREVQLRELSEQLLVGGENSIDAHLSDIREYITNKLKNLQALLAGDPSAARKKLLQHTSGIQMVPQGTGRKGCYIAKGRWNLLGNQSDTPDEADRAIRVVAGGGFEPPTFGL